MTRLTRRGRLAVTVTLAALLLLIGWAVLRSKDRSSADNLASSNVLCTDLAEVQNGYRIPALTRLRDHVSPLVKTYADQGETKKATNLRNTIAAIDEMR
ncbi:MAG: hypothetical protein QOG21_1832, partial [Actinomycetota bacterium]|nr:hypothetical protein [Actinomycetota bacterium]